jgi:hypothetical protein
MEERTALMIREYLPHDPDPSLEFGEYYYLQSTASGERIIRVYALDILPHRDGTEYGIYQRRGCTMVRIDSGWNDPNRGVHKSQLYDNRTDCKDQTHSWVENWEDLRSIQRKEVTR